MTSSSNTLPTFESFFKTTRFISYIIGLVPFYLDGETRKFDFLLHFFGTVMTINQFYITLTFILTILLEAKSVRNVIWTLPFLCFSAESCVRFLFVAKSRKVINELLSDLKFLYQIPWKGQSLAVSELNSHRKLIDTYIYISCITNGIFVFSPLLVTLFVYLAWHEWSPIFLADSWTAFNRNEHPILAYLIEIQAPRYVMSAIIASDCIMMLVIIHLNYHFESLGHAIIEVVKRGNTKAIDEDTETETNAIKSLKEAVVMHSKLIRYCLE